MLLPVTLLLPLKINMNDSPMSTIVAPSILAADFARLHRAISIIDQSDAGWVHIDVMDGHFVPNISLGFPIIRSIRPLTDKPFDVHLMIQHPDQYIEAFKEAGADRITVHAEACAHLDRTLAAIREMGLKNGVALNPHTPISLLQHVLPYTDLVLIMSVNPGFGGQAFIPYSLEKVGRLRLEIDRQGLDTLIEVDGGVNMETGKELVKAGVDVLVAGSFVFKHEHPVDAISGLHRLSRGEDSVLV